MELTPERIEAEHKRDTEQIITMSRKELNAEAAHRYLECMNIQNELARSSIENEKLRQQLAQREAEVAEAIAIVKAMSPKHAITCPANIGSKTCHCDSESVNEWIVGQLGDLPTKAEAHDAKVWNEAINAVSRKLKYELEETAWFDESVLDVTESLLKPEPN